jgi:hypothetical protein
VAIMASKSDRNSNGTTLYNVSGDDAAATRRRRPRTGLLSVTYGDRTPPGEFLYRKESLPNPATVPRGVFFEAPRRRSTYDRPANLPIGHLAK